MLPTLLSIAAVALASPIITFSTVDNSDYSLNEKTVYVDAQGILNLKDQGQVFKGRVDENGVFTGVGDTPGYVGVGKDSAGIRLFSNPSDTDTKFSLTGGELLFEGQSGLRVCGGYQLWHPYDDGDCGDLKQSVMMLTHPQEGDPNALDSTTIGPTPTGFF